MLKLRILALLIFLTVPATVYAQSGIEEDIRTAVQEQEVKMQVHFLASDELAGRETGTPGLEIAARYISTWFMAHGVQPPPGYDDYYQPVPLQRIFPASEGNIVIGDSLFTLPADFVPLNSRRETIEAPVVLLDHGLNRDIDREEIEGKIAIVRIGGPGQSSPQQWFNTVSFKNEHLGNLGAEAVIELYDSPQLPWSLLSDFLNRETLVPGNGGNNGEIPHIWLNTAGDNLMEAFAEMEGSVMALTLQGNPAKEIYSNNVVGYVEGTDPELKDEYILLGAHYDHIGVTGEEEGNTVYNGARDNAVGTSAILFAARYLAKNPPARSVLLAAWTAEEMGLLGSRLFSENPPVPLNQIVYNLNIDGAGYNDTTKVTVIGLERTDAEEEFRASAGAFGLTAIPDPVPEQNLFNRSDNVNFASKGIPAPTYSLGLTAFDGEINRYYHTVEDEPHTINYPYITQYIRSFLLASWKVAHMDPAPFWREGDPYEQAGRELYGLEPVPAEE